MEPFKTLRTTVIPLLRNDVDTDQIIPARYLKVTDKRGLGAHLFSDWRYLEDGSANPDFILNRAEYRKARALLAGENFGCGSSREHAPWALVDWGLRTIIALSFADIFRGNALKNGLLPIAVDQVTHARLRCLVQKDPRAEIEVDVAAQTLRLPDGTSASFPADPFAVRCLLEGIDELGYLQSFDEQITAFERSRDRMSEGS
jgi:3-isopropylmalate/(R)-2-methylmalate dehydratase small subunit